MDRREDASEVYPTHTVAEEAQEIAELARDVAALAEDVAGKVSKSSFGAFDNINLGDGATQKEVREALQLVIEKLKAMKGES